MSNKPVKKESGKVIAKANRVKKLLENKDLQQAFDDVKGALHTQFDQIPPSDLEAMVKIKERLHLLASVEENLKAAIKDGALEEFRLREQETPPYLGDILEWRKRAHKR